MKKEKAINVLKEIRNLSSEFETYEIREIDLEALEYAIKELERTAQEVPVQEQSISNNLKANITIKGLNVLEKFSTDSSLGIDTICTDKTSVEVNLFES